MDAFDLRMKFRESIRRREIEEIKKTKRQLFCKQMDRQIEEQKAQQLYKQIINQPQKIFETPQNYLQILREALHWEKAYEMKHFLSDVLFNLLKFHDSEQNKQRLNQNIIILLIECIAMIYFMTAIEFLDFTKRSIDICMEYLKKHQIGDNVDSRLIKNRCLVGIENITCCPNIEIRKYCSSKELLECLQIILEDFPTENADKLHILEIYGNVVEYRLIHDQLETPVHYYPQLLQRCIEENYDIEILARGIEIAISLIKHRKCDTLDILENLQCLYFCLSSANFYVKGTQQLVAVSLQFLAMDLDTPIRNQEPLLMLISLLELLPIKYSKQADPFYITLSYTFIGLIKSKYFDEILEQEMSINLTKQLCNYWVNLQIEFSLQSEFNCLKFFQQTLNNFGVANFLYKEAKNQIKEQNDLRAPTWEIVMEFLKNVELENSSKIMSYLLIFQNSFIWEMILEPYLNSIIEKIQGCRYGDHNIVTEKAEQILKIYEQNSKAYN